RDMTLSSKRRLNRPRQLITYQKGKWALDSSPPNDLQYVFISWQWDAFGSTEEERKTKVHLMAEYMTRRAGLTAYWLDNECNAPKSEPALLTSDVHRMSDVIRGSNHVALLLPDGNDYRMRDWGQRMWTLPEGLLAPGQIRLCTWQGEGKYHVREMGKVEMTSQFWLDKDDKEGDCVLEEVPSRILAENFAGLIDLSPLELFSLGLAALCNRTTSNNFTRSDEAYALMGLLHYRIDTDETDELFQVVARLSLANDSDHFIERIFAMFPLSTSTIRDMFKICADKDQYRTHLWDIQPNCQVVGIGAEPNTVILNNCKAVTIRWRQFPRIHNQTHEGLKKLFAQLFVTSGAWWVIQGYSLAFTYAPFLLWIGVSNDQPLYSDNLYKYLVGLIGGFLATGFLLSFSSPYAVRRLFSSQALKSAPHLVGFEGIMPIDDIEEVAFGNCQHRLTYEPSATPYSAEKRNPKFRMGEEPDWVRDSNPAAARVPLQPGHRLFTLVDTGNLTVSIFQAERPPSVALICGAEGGALRAVL
ncbi:MAG: hypothetical protein Q9187_009303, partial [Circinaria calcarea]